MVDCPYCGEIQYANLFEYECGYKEDEVYHQDCDHCNHVFVYTATVSYSYEVDKAPCLNGGEHNWKKVIGYPEEFFKGQQYCTYCDGKRKV